MAKEKDRKNSKDRPGARGKEPDLGELDSFTRKILQVPKEAIDKAKKPKR